MLGSIALYDAVGGGIVTSSPPLHKTERTRAAVTGNKRSLSSRAEASMPSAKANSKTAVCVQIHMSLKKIFIYSGRLVLRKMARRVRRFYG